MQNLTQIKSRQFHKYTTIEPYSRETANRFYQDQKIQSKQPSLMRSPNQNNYHLANVVKQILEMKPRTAQKLNSKQSSRNHKTETIVEPKPSLQFFCNNAKRNRQRAKECDNSQEDQVKKSSLSKQKSNFNFLHIDNRLNTKKVVTSKSSRAFKRQYYKNNNQSNNNNFDSASDIKNIQEMEQKVEPISKTVEPIEKIDSECRIRITKRKTEHQIPKSKLSIKNLDKLIEMAPHKSEGRGKPLKYDLNLPRHPLITKDFQQDCELIDIKGWKERRTKKSITDFKVPDFIKVSLEAYQQEPNYLIEELEKRKAREQPPEKIEQGILEHKIEEERIEEPKQFDEQVEDQNIMTNKLKLLEKEKRKIGLNCEAQIDSEVSIPAVSQNKIEKKKAKIKKKEQNEQKLNICGWQEQDPSLPQTLYFKV